MELPPDDHDLIARLEALAKPETVISTSTDDKRATTADDSKTLDDCLARLATLAPGDIPALIWCLSPIEQRATGWPPEPREILRKIQELCDQLIQNQTTNTDIAFASIYQYAQSLRACLSGTAQDTTATTLAAPEPAPETMMSPAQELASRVVLDDFVAETRDLLSEAEMLLLPERDLDGDGLAAVFRAFHTIKGMSAYLGQPQIERLAHGVEDRLGPVRDGVVNQDADLRTLLMAGVDGLRAMALLVAAQGNDAGPLPPAAAPLAKLLGLEIAVQTATEVFNNTSIPRIGDLLEAEGISRSTIEHAAATLAPGERLGDKLVQQGVASRETVEDAANKQQAAKATNDGFARVSISRLDEMMNMVGELLIAQAMVVQEASASGSTQLGQLVGRQSRILRDLQVLSLSLRMVPLKGLFQKMARAIHDTARKLGKDIEFRMVGDDTEIDRTLAETLADPLMHMVRNAVDHGIDAAEERARRGKPAKGLITLTAGHAGDAVVLSLQDDGRGMDPEKLRAKAVSQGLVPADKQLSPQEAYQLIFLPGFSTAEQVTGISGRGVGMDVVRRNISQMKGSVEIASAIGAGSTFTIRLPLTTAILDAMVLKVGAERFLIPVSAIIHALRPAPEAVKTVLGQGRLIESRGELLSVVSLSDRFHIPGAIEKPEAAILVVFEHFAGRIALQVDEILGQQQVVIKPLDRQYAHHPGLAGTAILGDGRVGLIVDPAHLVAASQSG